MIKGYMRIVGNCWFKGWIDWAYSSCSETKDMYFMEKSLSNTEWIYDITYNIIKTYISSPLNVQILKILSLWRLYNAHYHLVIVHLFVFLQLR